jgi:hypothetical protein
MKQFYDVTYRTFTALEQNKTIRILEVKQNSYASQNTHCWVNLYSPLMLLVSM